MHLRKVCRDLGLGIGDVQYHVDRLERDGSVESSRSGTYRRLYVAGIFGENEGAILSALSLRTPRELILHLIDKPGLSQEGLASELGLSRPSVSWNVKRLVRLGLVERGEAGRSTSYRVVGDQKAIAGFVKSYHPGVWARWSSRLADVVTAMAGKGEPADR